MRLVFDYEHFLLLDIQNHFHEQLMVVVRSFYPILLDVYQSPDHLTIRSKFFEKKIFFFCLYPPSRSG